MKIIRAIFALSWREIKNLENKFQNRFQGRQFPDKNFDEVSIFMIHPVSTEVGYCVTPETKKQGLVLNSPRRINFDELADKSFLDFKNSKSFWKIASSRKKNNKKNRREINRKVGHLKILGQTKV